MALSLQIGGLVLAAVGAKTSSPKIATAPDAQKAAQAYGGVAARPVTSPARSAEDIEDIRRQTKEARASKRSVIGDAKGRAREKIQRLVEQLKLMRKLYADNPKMMAKQLAALAKELKGVVKEYAAAAKASGELFSQSLDAPADAAIPADAREADRKEIMDEAKAEAGGDMDFIKEIRGLSKALKEDLLTAKTKAILTVKGKFEQSEEYLEAEKGLKDLDKSTDDLDRDIRQDMPAGSLMKLEA